MQPVFSSQASSVHGLPSSQLKAFPSQTPWKQASSTVHASSSSQGFWLNVFTQPCA